MRSFYLASTIMASVMSIGTVAQGITIFGANYDNSKSAGIAAGNPVPIVSGDTFSVINTSSSKFGAGSLDTTGVFSGGNGLKYDTASNFNPLAGTIDFWVQMPNGYNGVRQDLFSIFAGGFTGDFSLYINPDFDRLTLVVDVAGANQWVQNSQGGLANAILGDTNWHHIAWEWDTVAEFSTLYVDGIGESFAPLFGTVDFTGGTLGTDMEIGSRQGGFDAFQGNIDDLRIFDTAIYNQVASFTPPTQSVIPDAGVPGDLNNDTIRSAADFTSYVDNFGAPESNISNGDGSGTVDIGDYNLWKTNFDSGQGAGTVLAGANVPEPASMLLLVIGLTTSLARIRIGK